MARLPSKLIFGSLAVTGTLFALVYFADKLNFNIQLGECNPTDYCSLTYVLWATCLFMGAIITPLFILFAMAESVISFLFKKKK